MGGRVSSLDTSMNIAALVLAILDKNIKTPEQAFEKLYMKNYTTTTDDVQVMIQMREKGMTYREIGLIYGMTESGVCHKIQRYKKRLVEKVV